MNDENALNQLAGGARQIASAETPAEVFKSMLEASRAVAPRAAVFMLRRGEVHGWGSVGYATAAAQSQRSYRAAADEGWLGEVARDPEGAPVARTGLADDPDFGQDASTAATGCVLRIDGKPIALLVAERTSDASVWLPEGLALLASMGRMRVELNLARRRLAENSATAMAATTENGTSAPAATAPEPETDPTAADAKPEFEGARRYARLVATDIRLYNEEAVKLGRRNGDLCDRLSDHMGRGKETFLRRHGDLGPEALELLHQAYVQVLAGGDDGLIARGALD